MSPSVGDGLPSANNPALMLRLLELVCAGVRSQRSLEEVLAVDARTVRYYRQAAVWLALVEDEERLSPTDLGLQLVYRRRHRKQVWAAAVWAVPFVARLMSGQEDVPSLDRVTQTVLAVAPDLAAATARRKASAVRAWITAAGSRPAPAEDRQLTLPFTASPARRATLTVRPLGDADPDVYRHLLRALLEHGELGLGHLRAVLDEAGVPDQAIGPYVDLALTRGDAWRVGDRLVATPGAVDRGGLLATTSSIILSHPPFRELLDLAAAGAAGDATAAARARSLVPRLRPWALRLFGAPVDAAAIPDALNRLLMDRPVADFPIARPAGDPPAAVAEGFAYCWRVPGQLIALPPWIETLERGLPAVARALETARTHPADAGLPGVATVPVRVHSGLIHPGERLPRTVPDGRSLRLRLLLHAPYPAMVAAFLLAHRTRPDGGDLTRAGGWHARVQGTRTPLLQAIDGFARGLGHVPIRPPEGRQAADRLVRVLETLGVVTVLGGDTAILSERFFLQTRTEAEEMEVAALLGPMGEAMSAG